MEIGQDTRDPFPAKIDIIDILRGVAALLVVIGHIWGLMWAWDINFPRIGNFFDTTFAPDIFRVIGYPLVQFGSLGVALFFAISGFCIHYGFLRGKEGATGWAFMLRRIFRIFPVFLFSLLAIVFVMHEVFHYLGNTDFTLYDILTQSSLLFNFFVPAESINPVYWTLPIEFQLYILYLFILFLRKRIGVRKILFYTFILETFMFTMIVVYVKLLHIKINYFLIFNTPLAFWFDWMIGAYVAERFLQHERAFKNWMLAIPIAGLAGATVWFPLSPFRYMFGAMLGAFIIDACVRKEFIGRIWKTLSWFGLISYSMYLWHLPVMSLLVTRLLKNKVINDVPAERFAVACGAFILVAVPLSYLTYRYIERPGIALGKRIIRRLSAG